MILKVMVVTMDSFHRHCFNETIVYFHNTYTVYGFVPAGHWPQTVIPDCRSSAHENFT